MAIEDKEILLKDLCSRLLYGVIGEYSWKRREPYNRELTGTLYDELKSSWNSTGDSEFFPYLRPMSSMNEEERNEIRDYVIIDEYNRIISDNEGIIKYINWLNRKMFDYRGLIEKGLALEALEGMYEH